MSNFIRTCPICKKNIYHANKYQLTAALKRNSPCISCGQAARPLRSQETRKKMSESHKGEKNHFFGKHHSEETKKKIVENRDQSFATSEEFKEKMSEVTRGKNNGMYGKTVYGQWVIKHGKEKADELMTEYKKKQSFNNKGEKNNMFGVPAPKGCGSGWQGWYKGWFFRSLKELSYMINVIEKNNISWKNAESKDLSIKYIDHDGTPRTYRADFLLNDKILVEIKPKALIATKTNSLKKEAALRFCESNNFEYKIEHEFDDLTTEEISKMRNEKIIIFNDRTEKKFIDQYLN